MKDYLVKALAFDGKVRVYVINSTELVSQLQKSHDTWPTASAALGRAATIGAMMGAMLKGDEKLTIQIKGDGPIGQIVIDANNKGEVRGYVTNPVVDIPKNKKGKLDVARAVGKGNIYIIKDLGLKEPYRGSIPIVSGELGEDFTYYFAHSEQTPSAVAVGVLVNKDYSIKAAGGFIIQILPNITDEEISLIERTLENFPPVSSLIDQGLTPEDILEKLFADPVQILEKMDIQFKCNCSKERIKKVLISLGKEEIEDMIEKEDVVEVVCQFCNTKYHYNKEELGKLLEALGS
ncbi:Hsp33 family molecular chaperone [Vulcanibacillus modesticaldus]|uniref:33 kDa chaperonin n=1 Tax=Vulcanibacillus modesticaldus TaxID=337097 RepID=A0A1D2YX26_9BACI|nr:Hsp33 family molecular chaperone HslO [Vulcanibacillus modesticaldus]OEG00315.1 Hsp33 family molecular chaperone [Vulcanibacillus modesticaldus]